MLDATATIAPAPATTAPPNGLHYDPTTDPDSPLADSPDTPINTVSDVAVKITSDVPEVESDVRHEPYQISLSKLDDASLAPQIDTPIAPGLSFFPLSSLSSSSSSPSPPVLTRFNLPFPRYASSLCHSFPQRPIYGRRRFSTSKRDSSTRGC